MSGSMVNLVRSQSQEQPNCFSCSRIVPPYLLVQSQACFKNSLVEINLDTNQLTITPNFYFQFSAEPTKVESHTEVSETTFKLKIKKMQILRRHKNVARTDFLKEISSQAMANSIKTSSINN